MLQFRLLSWSAAVILESGAPSFIAHLKRLRRNAEERKSGGGRRCFASSTVDQFAMIAYRVGAPPQTPKGLELCDSAVLNCPYGECCPQENAKHLPSAPLLRSSALRRRRFESEKRGRGRGGVGLRCRCTADGRFPEEVECVPHSTVVVHRPVHVQPTPAVRDAPPLLVGPQFRHSSFIDGLVLTRPPRSGRAGHTKYRGLGSRPRSCAKLPKVNACFCRRQIDGRLRV